MLYRRECSAECKTVTNGWGWAKGGGGTGR